MLILVTGATGYIASRLIPQLLARGHQVRAFARRPEKLRARSWYPRVEAVQGDVTDFDSLASAMKDVHTAYYLVHNMASGRGYTSLEIQSAQNFARAAEQADVKHIIYLGGLADPEQHIAPHMRARIETGVTLRKGKTPVTEFRAGVVAGSGSISFEMIRFMTELLPIIPAPVWLKNKTQPIAVQNVVDYLLAALENWDGHGQVFEIGGPKIYTYQELMSLYARARGHKRGFFLLPYLPIEFMAFGVGLTTPVPQPIARALIGGLSRDSIVLHHNAQQVYPIPLLDFESATKDALEHLHPHRIERVWDGGIKIKHEGFLIDQRVIKVKRPNLRHLSVKGFALESKTDREMLFFRETKYGAHWLQYIADEESVTQTSYFAPRGFMGFLYGYGLFLFCRRILQKIKKAVFVT